MPAVKVQTLTCSPDALTAFARCCELAPREEQPAVGAKRAEM